MAVYSAQYNYLFFASPQTGSKAIAKTLQDRLGGQQMPEQNIKRDGKLIAVKHHTTYKMLLRAELLTQVQIDGAYKFCGVRNPWDLLVSRYLKQRGRFAEGGEKAGVQKRNEKKQAVMEAANVMEFPEWLASSHKEFIDEGKPVNAPMLFVEHSDHVIRFEALQQGFDEVLKHLGITEPISVAQHNVTTERVNSGKKRDFREFYDDTSAALVGQLYAPLITRFGYTFDKAPGA